MNVLIFSDSHGRAKNIEEVLARQTERAEAVIFLGDGLRDLDRIDTGDSELYCVRGNCDTFSPFYDEEEQVVFLGGLKIFIAHGHRYLVKSGCSAIAEKALRIGADIVMFGHTHTPLLLRVEKGQKIGDTVAEKPLYIFNPGSIAEGNFGTLTVRSGNILLNNAYL